MTIKNVIFDFGGVLVDWNVRYLLKDYFKTEAETMAFLNKISFEEWNSSLDWGYPFAKSIVELQEKFPEYFDLFQRFYDDWEQMLGGCFTKTEALIEKLKEDGYALYGLTNWSAETFPIAYNKYPVFKNFDAIAVSGAEKLAKPDERFYRILLDRYDLNPEECIFIDDRQDNIETANKLGIHGIVFDNEDTIEAKVYAALK